MFLWPRRRQFVAVSRAAALCPFVLLFLCFPRWRLPIRTSTHLHICTSAHLHICTSAHQHISISAHLHICTSAHPHICTSAYLHIHTSAHQRAQLAQLRLGNKNESFQPFVLYFARLALTLHTESKSVLLT